MLQIVGIGAQDCDVVAFARQSLADLGEVAAGAAGHRVVELNDMQNVHEPIRSSSSITRSSGWPSTSSRARACTTEPG